MGKWASYQKRGTARQQGQFAPPVLADWSFSGITTNSITVNRVGTPPPPATGIWSRAKASSGGNWVAPQFTTTTQVYGALASVTSYDFQVAWGTATAQLSDWSPIRQQSTV